MSRRPPRTVEPRQIVTILMLVVCLIAVLVLKSRCGPAVGELFRAVGPTADAGAPRD